MANKYNTIQYNTTLKAFPVSVTQKSPLINWITDLFDIKNLVLSQSPSRVPSGRTVMKAHSFSEIDKFKVLLS